jgi:hypothetical protein
VAIGERIRCGRSTWSLFYDKDNIRAGQRWQERLREELTSRRVVLALLSRSWLGSPCICRARHTGARALPRHAPDDPTTLEQILDETLERLQQTTGAWVLLPVPLSSAGRESDQRPAEAAAQDLGRSGHRQSPADRPGCGAVAGAVPADRTVLSQPRQRPPTRSGYDPQDLRRAPNHCSDAS